MNVWVCENVVGEGKHPMFGSSNLFSVKDKILLLELKRAMEKSLYVLRKLKKSLSPFPSI